MSKAGFFFYTGDWIKDTRCLSAEARGCWIDLLCVLSERDGSVTWTMEAFGKYWGMQDTKDILYDPAEILEELENTKTADVHKNGHFVTVTCRRMVRESKTRETERKRQQRHRAKKTVTPEYSASSSSESSSLQSHPRRRPPSAGSSDDEKEGKMRSANLPPVIKVFTDQLWKISEEKYRKGNLTALVHHFRKNYGDEVIADCFKRLVDQAENADDWRAWLVYMIDVVKKDFNAKAFDAWWQKTKLEDRAFAEKFAGELEQKLEKRGWDIPGPITVKEVPEGVDEVARRRLLQHQARVLRGDK